MCGPRERRILRLVADGSTSREIAEQLGIGVRTVEHHRNNVAVIVDDSPKFRALIETVLTGLVDEVYECADGDEAVAAYGARRPDWVLMDFKMARMGGLEATRRILAADRRARVLIVTGYDDARWRAAAIAAGACGYVLKDNLLDVRRLLNPGNGF